MNLKDSFALNQAARAGDLAAVTKLLAAQSAPPGRKPLNEALLRAVECRHTQVMEYLLAAGAEANHATPDETVLMAAARNGDLASVDRLIQAGANIHREVRRENALSAALSRGQAEMAAHLAKLGATTTPEIALFHACKRGDLARVKSALAAGAKPEQSAKPLDGSALMVAARLGHLEIVECLLQHGANPNSKIDGWTALGELVVHGKSLSMIDVLARAGADVNEACKGVTPLMNAAAGGWLPAFDRLLELGANPRARDEVNDMTVLDHAKTGDNQEIIARLMNLGASSPLDEARSLAQTIKAWKGGKLHETGVAVLLEAKIGGFPCRFTLNTTGGQALFRQFHLREPATGQAGDAILRVSSREPAKSSPGWENVEAASALLGWGVYRPADAKGFSPQFVNKFCARQEQRFKELALTCVGTLEIGANRLCLEWETMKEDDARACVDALAEIARAIGVPRRPTRQLLSSEWLLKPVGKPVARPANARWWAGMLKAGEQPAATASLDADAPNHRLGGKLAHPVACPECGLATNLMAEIDLGDPALPDNPLGRERVPVFWCLTCLEWDPAFFELSRPFVTPLPNHPREDAAKAGAEPGESDVPEQPLKLVPAEKKAGRKSKLGGAPTWIQGDETPDCPKCEEPMAFALQLASNSKVSYGDMGVLYAFVCEKCRVTSSLVQSH